MRNIIGAINMTLDGVFDHTAGLPDEEFHRNYTTLLGQGDNLHHTDYVVVINGDMVGCKDCRARHSCFTPSSAIPRYVMEIKSF